MSYAETAQELAQLFYKQADTERICVRDEGRWTAEAHAMVYAASDDLSEDYAYSMTREVLNEIWDAEPDDLSDVDVSGLVDVYNADLMRFIADGTNWTLADEVKEEHGDWPDSFIGIVSAAQELAYRRVLDTIISKWPDDDESDDADDDCDDDSEDDE